MRFLLIVTGWYEPNAPSTFSFFPLLQLSPFPLHLHHLLHSLHPYSAQVDRCLADWPVIITVVLGVSCGWRWLFFEYFTARTGQDRTFPEAMGEGRRNEDRSRNKKRGVETRVLIFVFSLFFLCLFLLFFGKKVSIGIVVISEQTYIYRTITN